MLEGAGIGTSEFLSAALHVAIVIGILLELKLLVSSWMNYEFAIARNINGLKLRSAQSTVRRKIATIVAFVLLFNAPSTWAHLAALVLVCDVFFGWRDLEYFTRVLRQQH